MLAICRGEAPRRNAGTDTNKAAETDISWEARHPEIRAAHPGATGSGEDDDDAQLPDELQFVRASSCGSEAHGTRYAVKSILGST